MKQQVVNQTTGKGTKLTFEKQKPPSKLSHAVKAAPLNTLSATAHREIQKHEDENVGLEAAHRAETGAESAARLTESAIRSQRLRSNRKAEPEQPASMASKNTTASIIDMTLTDSRFFISFASFVFLLALF